MLLRHFCAISFFCLSTTNLLAQEHYKAFYSLFVKYDSSLIGEKEIPLGTCKKITARDTSSQSIVYLKQLNKYLLNSTIIEAECNPLYDVFYINHRNINDKLISSNTINIKSKDSLLLYVYNKKYAEAYNKNNEFMPCKAIDTSKLIFNSTNNKKQIFDLNCVEYRINNYKENPLSLWVSYSLDKCINPGIFGVNIPGGIVEVDYAENKIILKKLVKVNSTIAPLPDCNIVNSSPIDIVNTGILNVLK